VKHAIVRRLKKSSTHTRHGEPRGTAIKSRPANGTEQLASLADRKVILKLDDYLYVAFVRDK
jgi:hypothetical protein